MQIRYFLALCLLPNIVLAEEAETTELPTSQCVVEPPVSRSFEDRAALTGIDDNQIVIISDYSNAAFNDKAQFTGDVSFSQGQRHIAADSAVLDQKNQRLNADGNLIFKDELFTVTAQSLEAQMSTNSATLEKTQYWLHGQQVHGDASKLQITSENNLLLTKTNFTTCPPGDESWLLEADMIKIDSTEEWGEIWNAKLRIADVPILYIPYMTVPVSDKRKSGFLFPSFSTSTTNGIEVSTPYYWNIAPEYDLTFNPIFMSSRGLYTKTEFRYLAGEQQSGQFNVEYLDSDDNSDSNANRYLYHWSHSGAINKNWRVRSDFTDVSDNNYFNDLDSDVNQSTDNQLSRIGEASYFERNWDFNMRVQDIKVLGEDEKPYQVMPQLNFNYRTSDIIDSIDFKFNSELTNFSHQDNEYNTATRVHMVPSLLWPIQGPAGSFTSEVKLMQTQYWQQNLDEDATLDDSVSRTIPQARLHGQVNFERATQLFDSQYRQTLEPQVQYLYVGYDDQSNIGIYDTAELQEDYYGLFRDRQYSGLDRIADANQFTLGFTTRLFDDNNREQFKFSVGQIMYLESSKVTLDDTFAETSPSTSVLAAELDAQLYNDWFISGSVQHDTETGENKKNEVTLDFRPSNDKLLQLSYRYVPDLLNTNTNDQVDISQAGLRTSWPLSDSLYFVGNYYYDLNESRNIETYTGVQYEACCWAVRLSYHYRIKTNYDDDLSDSDITSEEFESGVYLNFVIKGLGGSGPLGVADMLNEGLFNYRKPLYLRN
ncbi:LPS assembly protein LptD [Shewanella inventionis]|uniref:LPS-assembly protein LptD n=1 Tax=Shewanella inventionis TaxID=1738770 RepID=A0ABQ1J6M8_9GAMM|nr:LPS assembly protein LptD [Shewanella inventionis]MCL1158699.1 LPS assembly protein LptD [Shewanella inventionis]UAL45440.1 LPS assembly protein LptD [Shewanella inventionis]GGB61370.1 LPS-assembly protein LptD [Shewanella inventionis]